MKEDGEAGGGKVFEDRGGLRGVFHDGAAVTFAEKATIRGEQFAPGEQVFLVSGDQGGIVAEVVFDQAAFEEMGEFGGALAMGLAGGIVGQRSVGIEDGHRKVGGLDGGEFGGGLTQNVVFPELDAVEAVSAEAGHEVADGDSGDARAPTILFQQNGVDVDWVVIGWHVVIYTRSGVRG